MSDHSGQTSEMGRADGPTMIWTRWRGEALASVDRYGPRRNSTVTSVRLVAGEPQMADVRQQVVLSLITEFENLTVFKPGDHNLPALNTMLDQVVAWSTALTPLRDTAAAAA